WCTMALAAPRSTSQPLATVVRDEGSVWTARTTFRPRGSVRVSSVGPRPSSPPRESYQWNQLEGGCRPIASVAIARSTYVADLAGSSSSVTSTSSSPPPGGRWPLSPPPGTLTSATPVAMPLVASTRRSSDSTPWSSLAGTTSFVSCWRTATPRHALARSSSQCTRSHISLFLPACAFHSRCTPSWATAAETISTFGGSGISSSYKLLSSSQTTSQRAPSGKAIALRISLGQQVQPRW